MSLLESLSFQDDRPIDESRILDEHVLMQLASSKDSDQLYYDLCVMGEETCTKYPADLVLSMCQLLGMLRISKVTLTMRMAERVFAFELSNGAAFVISLESMMKTFREYFCKRHLTLQDLDSDLLSKRILGLFLYLKEQIENSFDSHLTRLDPKAIRQDSKITMKLDPNRIRYLRFERELEEKFREDGLFDELKELKQWPPQKEFSYDHGPTVLYPSQGFDLMSQSGKKRRALVVYVLDEKTQQLKPRFLYVSSTHAVVKVMPRVLLRGSRIFNYDKGPAEESVTVAIPYQLPLMKAMYPNGDVLQDDLPVMTTDKGRESLLVDLVQAENVFDRYETEAMNHSFMGKVDAAQTRFIRDFLPKGEKDYYFYMHPENFHLLDADPTKDPDTDGDYLSLKLHGKVQIFSGYHGAMKVYDMESQHPENPMRYLAHMMRAPKQFRDEYNSSLFFVPIVEDARPESREVNTYLTCRSYVECPELTVPILEKSRQIQMDTRDWEDDWEEVHGLVHSRRHWGHVFMWPYLKKLPFFKYLMRKKV
ncbi:MAG: hypothetical protein P1V18_05965 [Candidatus Gracilibacteria bacterium]|nr:hypothetical protein [Candidatus Gracilibacteria bacterium]